MHRRIKLQAACIAIFAIFTGICARAEDSSLATQLSAEISKQLSEKIPNARIKLPSLDHVASLAPLSEIQTMNGVRFVEDKAAGVAVVEVFGSTEGGREVRQIIQTPYEAWMRVPTATKRIFPNSKLKSEDFKTQEVNVASGIAREFRGVMLESDAKLETLESRQTILEGQFVTRSAVQKQPDLRKGEMISLELTSGDLSLTTQAIVQESASIGDRVHVLTLKTKKEIVGKVRSDRTVEVSL